MRTIVVAMILVMALPAGLAVAQAPAAPAAPTGQKTLAATMGVYVFPTEGQAPEVQSKDEADCYTFAVQNTGTDPFELQKKSAEQQAQAQKQKEQAAQAGKGAAAGGAVKGAAAGALIGEIASDDAGKGAAYGAAAGVIAGRRRAARAKGQATKEAEAQAAKAAAATQEQMDGFRKAFSVCLEAKKYMVKF